MKLKSNACIFIKCLFIRLKKKRLTRMIKQRKRPRRSQKISDDDDKENSIFVAWDDTTARSSFEASSTTATGSGISDVSSFTRTCSDLYPIDFSSIGFSSCTAKTLPQPEQPKGITSKFPTDYRPGTKIRLISDSNFPSLLKSSETVVGEFPVTVSSSDYDQAFLFLINEVRDFTNLLDVDKIFIEKSAMQLLHPATIYHQFPFVGSVQMFPRLKGSSSTLSLKSSSPTGSLKISNLQSIESNFMDFLGKEWLDAFDNLYESWREFRRNNFYLCASSFTVLFVNKANKKSSIIVTPTTSGFRQILRENEIEFSLPFKVDFIDIGKEDNPKDFLPLYGDATIDLDHDEWLKDIGQTDLRFRRTISEIDGPSDSVGSLTLGSKRSSLESINEDPSRSTIMIQNSQGIENFCKLLKTTKLATTKTGPQAGLPPTLISSLPFRKSSQRELTMIYQIVKKNGKYKYIVEMEGVILPFVSKMLVEFAKKELSSQRVQIQVTGRSAYSGMNEPLCSSNEEVPCNCCDFECNLSTGMFSW